MSADDLNAYRMRSASRRRGVVVRRLLIAADVLGLIFAFATLQALVGSHGNDQVPLDSELLLFSLSIPVFVVMAQARGLYSKDEERPDHTTVDDLVGVLFLVTFLVWSMLVAATITGFAAPDFGKWVIFWALSVVTIVLARSAARAFARRLPAYTQRTIVVGAGRIGQLVARKLVQHREYGIEVVGFVDRNARERRSELAHVPLLGQPEDLVEIVMGSEADRVVVAFMNDSATDLEETVRKLQAMGVQVDIVPRLFSVLGPNVELTTVEGLQLVSIPPMRMSRPALAAKRGFDLMVASLSLMILSPVFAVLAVLIKRDSPGPVFFRQTRLGIDQRPFTFLKFRTMGQETASDAHRDYIKQVATSDARPEGHGLYKLEQPAAVTSIGRVLRKTSLDELPQLLNVLRGDMSLVGPRPCIPYELEHFRPHHYERFTVPAGITGLWQVKARARSTFAEALDLDVAYARSWSFGLDLKLLLQTPVHMLQRSGTK